MQLFEWLQLFAEGDGGGAAGAEGGAVAETGVEGGDPGRQRLLELGVPQEKLNRRKNREYKFAKRQAAAAEPQPEAQTNEQTPAADNTPTEEAEKKPERMTWEQITADPEYKGKLQEMMQARLKSARGAEEALTKLQPAVDVLARKYGMDIKNIDHEALAKAIEDDDDFYEELAIKLGTSVEGAKLIDRNERAKTREEEEKKQREEAERDALGQQMMARHIEGVRSQGEAMKQKYPGFSLDAELKNPMFAKLTHPSIGLSVEDAYCAIHRKELEAARAKATAQATAIQVSNAIQSGSLRPAEAGTSSKAASVSSFSWKNATADQREAQKRAIREAAAQGRKLYPGRG